MGHEEYELRAWVRRIATGEASRRQFIRTMLGLGLSGPLIADMLATSTPAAAQDMPGAPHAFTPTRRGGGGKLRLLSWGAPTILNAHLATGTKDREASCVVYEPLISVNPEAELVPILAAEIPSVENGGRAPDGTWTVWRLKQGVVWHDGTPFTADDVLFPRSMPPTRPPPPPPPACMKESCASTSSTTIQSRWCSKNQPPSGQPAGMFTFCPSTALPSTQGQTPATHRTTSSQWAPAHTRLSTSNRGMWRSTKSIRTITSPTAPSLTRWS